MDSKRPGLWLILSTGGFGSTFAGPGRARALFARLLLALLSVTIVVPITGCSGGDDESEDGAKGSKKKKRKKLSSDANEGDEDVEIAREDASDLLDEVKAAGLKTEFASDYKRATGYLKKANGYEDDAEFSKARNYYKRAKNVFQEMLDESAESADQVADAADAQKVADEAKAKAKEAGADENAPQEWKDAEKYYKEALTSLRKRQVEDAVAAFEDAAATFDEAQELALDGKRDRMLAERFKTNMVGLKARAAKAGADSKAIDIWQQAESAEIVAETYLETGDFRGAQQNYRSATQMYTQALKSVMDDDAFAKEMAIARADQDKRLKVWQEQQALDRERAGRGLAGIPPPPPTGGAAGSPVAPGTGIYPPGAGFPPNGGGLDLGPPALCVKDLAVKFPQELDSEDEDFLIENLHHLSKVARYDPDTGGVELDYSNGERLAREIITGPTPKKHVWFRDKQLAAASGDIPESAWSSMYGNTKGFVQIPVPFIYHVRMTWSFGIETMTGKGNFGAFVNLNKKKKSRMRTNFADIGMIQGSSPPKWRRGKEPGPNANYWHTKQRDVNWVVEFTSEKPAGKSSMETIYDHLGEEEFNNKVQGKLNQSGFVGFEWSETRFHMKKLKICGFLDKKAAIAILRKQLGIEKGRVEIAAADDDDDDDDDDTAGDDDDDVTAAPSEDDDDDDDDDDDGKKAGASDPDEDFDF